MKFLARRIQKVAYWPCDKDSYSGMHMISADAITRDLATTQNELSWWLINSVNEAEKVGLSFISQLDKVLEGKLNIVIIPFEEISDKFEVKHTPAHGNTAIIGMEMAHYDVCALDYEKLGKLGDVVAKYTSHETHMYVVQFRIKDLFNKLVQYMTDGKLDLSKLGEYAKKKICA